MNQVALSPGDDDRLARIAGEVKAMAAHFPAPGLPTR
jgi:hypothetical protein